MSRPFPPDLPDLLRLACSQGKMLLNVFHGSRAETGRGFQANLANSGQGWTVDYAPDSLEAITNVLRDRFGRSLDHKRANEPEWKIPEDDGSITPEEVEQAVIDVLGAGKDSLPFSLSHVAEAIAEKLFPVERPKVHEVANVKLGEIDDAGDDFDSLIGDDDLESLL